MAAAVFGRAGLHTSLFYAAYYMAIGAHLPYWPLWLADWGLAPGEIGLFVALGMAIRVVAAVAVPSLADRLDARRHTVVAVAALGIAVFLAHFGIGSRAALFAATLAAGAVLAGIGPIGEALGVASARTGGFPYAQARGIGSGGFLLANLAIGALLPLLGADLVVWWITGCLVALVLLAPGHPGGLKAKGQVPPSLREIGALLVSPVFALFVATVALIQGSHAVLYAYGTLHWRTLGLSEPVIGALWAVGVGAEILLLVTVATAVVARIGAIGAMAVSGGAGILRWSAMMADPTGVILWPLQMLHAFTFAIGHVGAIAFLAQAIPPRFGAAAQGAMSATGGGLALAIGMMLAAAVYPVLGGLTYGVAALFSAGGLLLLAALARRWRGEPIAV